METLDLSYGVLVDLLTKDPAPELISLAERERSYQLEEEEYYVIYFISYMACHYNKDIFIIGLGNIYLGVTHLVATTRVGRGQ